MIMQGEKMYSNERKILQLIVIAICFSCVSCSSDDDAKGTDTDDSIGTVTEKSGIIRYDNDSMLWFIQVVNSYDSASNYYVNQLEEMYLEEGIHVVFSGDVYTFNSDRPLPVGYEEYMIDLKTIRKIETGENEIIIHGDDEDNPFLGKWQLIESKYERSGILAYSIEDPADSEELKYLIFDFDGCAHEHVRHGVSTIERKVNYSFDSTNLIIGNIGERFYHTFELHENNQQLILRWIDSEDLVFVYFEPIIDIYKRIE